MQLSIMQAPTLAVRYFLIFTVNIPYHIRPLCGSLVSLIVYLVSCCGNICNFLNRNISLLHDDIFYYLGRLRKSRRNALCQWSYEGIIDYCILACLNAEHSVCISVPLWQVRIFGLFVHAKSGYPDFFVQVRIAIFSRQIRISGFFVQVRIGPYGMVWYGKCRFI